MKSEFFLKARLPLLVLCLFLTACVTLPDPDPDPDPDPADPAVFTAKVDGEDFTVPALQISANYNELNAMVRTLNVGAVRLPIGGVTRAIALAIVSADSTDIEAGEVYTANSATLVAAGQWAVDDDSGLDIKAVSENTDIATITITAIDYDQKIVSGTFSFDAVDEDDLNTVYEIREGKFTDVPFD